MIGHIYPKAKDKFLSSAVQQFAFDETEKLGYKCCDYTTDVPDLDDYLKWSRELGLRIYIYRGDGIYATNCGYWGNRRYVATYKDIPVWSVAMPRHEWSLKHFYGQIEILDDIEHNEDWTSGHAWLYNENTYYLRQPVFFKCVELIKKFIDETNFTYEQFISLHEGKDPYKSKVHKGKLTIEDITEGDE